MIEEIKFEFVRHCLEVEKGIVRFFRRAYSLFFSSILSFNNYINKTVLKNSALQFYSFISMFFNIENLKHNN